MARVEAPVGSGSAISADILAGLTGASNAITGENPVIESTTLMSLFGLLPSTLRSQSVTCFATVTALEATESTGHDFIYQCQETDTFYRYEPAGSAYTVDHLSVCSTHDAGNTRFIGVAGRYVADGIQIREVIAAATGPLTEAQVRGTVINNYGQGAENTQTLPAAKAGLGFTGIVMTTGAGALYFKPATGEQVVLDGVLLDANHKVRLNAPALGDTFRALCLKYDADAWRWVFSTSQGTYDDGAE